MIQLPLSYLWTKTEQKLYTINTSSVSIDLLNKKPKQTQVIYEPVLHQF